MAVMGIVIFGIIPLGSAADLEKGKVLFGDPKLGKGNMGISCNSCHPAGEGLGAATGREDLKEIINLCIKKDMNGIGINPDGEEMGNLITFIESLQGKVKISERIAGFDCLEE
jgi:cytochrome c